MADSRKAEGALLEGKSPSWRYIATANNAIPNFSFFRQLMLDSKDFHPNARGRRSANRCLMVLQREYNRGQYAPTGPETWILEAVSPIRVAS
jgi:hypothetical protein